jgi:hypothetical protein
MHVEMRPITLIRPYEHNPRVNDAAVDAVAASIKEFGWRQPIVVDEQGVIVVGRGSGSTLIAAEQTGRKAFLMELDPLYSDVIVTRWEQFTGKQAVLSTPDYS